MGDLVPQVLVLVELMLGSVHDAGAGAAGAVVGAAPGVVEGSGAVVGSSDVNDTVVSD